MKPKSIVVDARTLVRDPESIEVLMNDVNTVFLHSKVIQELDKLKSQRDIGRDSLEVIRKIEYLHKDGHPRLKIVQQSDWSDPALNHLDRSKNDHHIIALAHNLKMQHDKWVDSKLISQITSIRILARDLGITAEDYVINSVDVNVNKIKNVKVPNSTIVEHGGKFMFSLENMDDYIENEGVVCWSDWDGTLEPSSNSEWGDKFTAIKKGAMFHIIDNNINMMHIKPFNMEKKRQNWEQYVAMQQLMDDDVKLSFLIGGAGTGKTILALAAALQQRKKFRNIMVTRPMVPLEDEDRMGFLPGDVNNKMSPWLRPIWRSLSFIANTHKDNSDIIQRVRDTNKLEIEPLDYIRGMTYVRDVLIIDEAQNLTLHQMKTIITRGGQGSKIIFTGDLGQIDRMKKMNAASSGLAYASVKMSDNPMVSIIHFEKTVRSELAHLAEKLL